MAVRGTRKRQASFEEIRLVKEANVAADARSAGFRRGFRGLPKDDGSRFSGRPEFAAGYEAGAAYKISNPEARI